MVCSDTKLHAEIIKLLFWNFHWGHYVSVSHLDSVNKHFELQSCTKDNFGLLVIVERSVMNLCKDLLGEHFVLQILLEVLAVDLERGVENKGVGNQRFCDFLGNPTPRFRD